jgi:hypothetical protein
MAKKEKRPTCAATEGEPKLKQVVLSAAWTMESVLLRATSIASDVTKRASWEREFVRFGLGHYCWARTKLHRSDQIPC